MEIISYACIVEDEITSDLAKSAEDTHLVDGGRSSTYSSRGSSRMSRD
jgi:hypothetical protein